MADEAKAQEQWLEALKIAPTRAVWATGWASGAMGVPLSEDAARIFNTGSITAFLLYGEGTVGLGGMPVQLLVAIPMEQVPALIKNMQVAMDNVANNRMKIVGSDVQGAMDDPFNNPPNS